MTREYIDRGFCCDWDGKHKAVNAFGEIYHKKGYLLYVDLQDKDPFAPIDFYLTAVSESNVENQRYAAVEFKERPDTAHTDCPDWIVELRKVKKLQEAAEKGYTPLYCYLWGDGYMAVWNINTWDIHKIGNLKVKPHTMGYEGEPKRLFEKWGVTLSSAVWQGYISDSTLN